MYSPKEGKLANNRYENEVNLNNKQSNTNFNHEIFVWSKIGKNKNSDSTLVGMNLKQ